MRGKVILLCKSYPILVGEDEFIAQKPIKDGPVAPHHRLAELILKSTDFSYCRRSHTHLAVPLVTQSGATATG